MKKDVLRWKDEIRSKLDAKPQKESKLTSLKHDLEQMSHTRSLYQAEMGSDLVSQLSVDEQREVDRLNDRIKELTLAGKDVFK